MYFSHIHINSSLLALANNAPLFSFFLSSPFRVVMEDKHHGAVVWRRERENKAASACVRVFVWVCLCVRCNRGTSWSPPGLHSIRGRHGRLSFLYLSCRMCSGLSQLFSHNPPLAVLPSLPLHPVCRLQNEMAFTGERESERACSVLCCAFLRLRWFSLLGL